MQVQRAGVRSGLARLPARGAAPVPLLGMRPHSRRPLQVTYAATKAMDGNEAAARIAYEVSDVSFIYPITPATPMGEWIDVWATAEKKNSFGNVVQVTEMDSEASVAGALHGALAAGALATTFTCSQGLLLMIPNMYKIAGELIPCVLHVSARALAGQALSIFGDHQDVMAVRQTGWAMLCSHSVQEAHDMALASHLATLESSVPFLHFFEGFRTSHEINQVSTVDQADIQKLFQAPEVQAAIRHHHERALNPTHPHQRGTAQGPEVYFQMVESSNRFHAAVPEVVERVFDKLESVTGRKYRLFEYSGHPEAERVIVVMGSGGVVVDEAVKRMVAAGEKVGVLNVRLFRPWSAAHFCSMLPKTVKRVSVLDRTKESGSQGEPLYLDVVASLQNSGVRIVGGRYGLGSKDFTPAMALSVFDNLARPDPIHDFTVGITDDVTFKSLPWSTDALQKRYPVASQEGSMLQCMFWGMGSDGTVGANKDAIKLIADNTKKFTQAYFAYDAKKSGGVTISHLRISDKPVAAPYLVEQADYLAIHNASYIMKYNLVDYLKPGSTLVINCPWDEAGLEKWLPVALKRRLAELDCKLYTIDAGQVARSVGLGKRINMVMQTVFFSLSGVMPIEEAKSALKKSIAKMYAKKGDEVVAQNQQTVDKALEHVKRVQLPDSWKAARHEGNVIDKQLVAQKEAAAKGGKDTLLKRDTFIMDVVQPLLAMEGDKLPVSVFTPGGAMITGTTQIEKRAIAATVPVWLPDDCTQCNICSFVCPHAAIRPALATPAELQAAGASAAFETRPAKGGPGKGLEYRMQISPLDCTGCQLCTQTCPDKALKPMPLDAIKAAETDNWNTFLALPQHPDVYARNTVKGSQFIQPLLEFSGACEGCGETAYVKLLTQLFGERMMIANATGCSSIWGGSAPSNPYTTNKDGRGPAWANSLFEDNAAFGFGIYMATKQRREALTRDVRALLADTNSCVSPALHADLSAWAETVDDAAGSDASYQKLQHSLPAETSSHPLVAKLKEQMDQFVKPSCWIIGGDGWAYDIGYGPLDHVFSTGENVNILVLDTEMYSNTGGQKSKATPLGAVAKFAEGGKQRNKKDLGHMAMQYQDVYVASVCLEANFNQLVKAMKEAESYPGVSLIVAYAPCQMHGIAGGMEQSCNEARLAVDAGYWPLYRYDPRNTEHPLQVDCKDAKTDVHELFNHEIRFNVLAKKAPEVAHTLQDRLQHFLQDQRQHLRDESHMMDHHHTDGKPTTAAK